MLPNSNEAVLTSPLGMERLMLVHGRWKSGKVERLIFRNVNYQ